MRMAVEWPEDEVPYAWRLRDQRMKSHAHGG